MRGWFTKTGPRKLLAWFPFLEIIKFRTFRAVFSHPSGVYTVDPIFIRIVWKLFNVGYNHLSMESIKYSFLLLFWKITGYVTRRKLVLLTENAINRSQILHTREVLLPSQLTTANRHQPPKNNRRHKPGATKFPFNFRTYTLLLINFVPSEKLRVWINHHLPRTENGHSIRCALAVAMR